MTTKLYASGWAFQKPDQNYFKKFLHLNRIAISGIVYPKRMLADIEGIPVLDFEDAPAAIGPGDCVIDISPNSEVRVALTAFFEAQGIERVSVPDFIDGMIADDGQDTLLLPVAGIQSRDIRHLQSLPVPDAFDAHFLDAESYEVAGRLDGIFRHSQWQRLVEFDRDNTLGNVLFDVLRDLQARGLLKHLTVLDTPRVFLDAILRLRLYGSTASFTVSLSDRAIDDLGARAEFYRRSLADCIVPFARRDGRSILLAGAPEPLMAANAHSELLSGICLMPRSIIDYVGLKNALGEHQYRILLRQPDTAAHNLIAAVLTPALFGI